MIVNQNDLPDLYQAIKEDKYSSDVKNVMVFTSVADADSISAVRILQVSSSSLSVHLHCDQTFLTGRRRCARFFPCNMPNM